MKIRAFIFDDEPDIRKLYKTLLETRGYEVIAFEDPSLFSFYNQGRCPCNQDEVCADLIITDISMTKVNGIEFIKSHKSNGCKVTDIIVISGYANQETQKKIKALGCKFLQKPFMIEDLFEILDEFESNIDSSRRINDRL
jgi:DNA-binding NtrC family response regulator